MHSKLSTLVGFTVLTLLLTAGAAQSLAGSNTVFSDDIAAGAVRTSDINVNAVTSSRIANGSVFGGDIANNSVTGADIDESTLTVTPADNSVASSEVQDDSLTGEDVNESTLVPTCPEGTTRALDVCYGPENVTASFQDAVADCQDAGMHLPTLSVGGFITTVADGSDILWVDNVFQDDGANKAATTSGGTGYQYNYFTIDTAINYRCVISVGSHNNVA